MGSGRVWGGNQFTIDHSPLTISFYATPIWQGFCFFLKNTLTMAIGEIVVARINEISFVLSLGVCAWFYRQFRKLELQQYNEELLEQLFNERPA